MEIEVTKKIVKVFVDGKHRKSFPLYLGEDFLNNSKTITDEVLKKMHKSTVLKEIDMEVIKEECFQYLFAKFKQDLSLYDKLTSDVIKDANPIGCRIVIPFQGRQRHELLFDNKLAVKCDDKLYNFSEKLPTAYLNY